jgi:hypothetical protein
MTLPPIVSPQEWEAACQELLVKEKELTRARDALAAERRRRGATLGQRASARGAHVLGTARRLLRAARGFGACLLSPLGAGLWVCHGSPSRMTRMPAPRQSGIRALSAPRRCPAPVRPSGRPRR